MPIDAGNFFLVIEGLDGSGKTTITRQLARSLRALHYNVYLTFEPHDASTAGLFIRQVLMEKLKVPGKTLALAFALNRAVHSNRVIGPFLGRGKHRIVVCDRYYLSSLVYQSSPELTMDEVMALNEGVRRPDLTVFLDASTRTCYRRMRERSALSEDRRDRELFEKRLEETRRKYENAISFLEERDQVIRRINADSEDMAETIDAITIELSKHGPDWLKPQLSLSQLAEEPLDSFYLDGLAETDKRIAEYVGGFLRSLAAEPPADTKSVVRLIDRLRGAVIDEVWQMPISDLGLLFMGYIQRLGYAVVDRVPWTDLCAYELEFTLPMHVKQRGTAVILQAQYRPDTIAKMMLSEKLAEVSDFMLVLDPSRSKLAHGYSRDLVLYGGGRTSLSPSTSIVGRADISRFLLSDVVAEYWQAHPGPLADMPETVRLIDSLVGSSGTSLGELGTGQG